MSDIRPGRGVVIAALLLAVLMAAFIVYGSLYPFRYRPLPPGVGLAEAAGAALLRWRAGRGDVAANLLLYGPLGLLLAIALAARLRPFAAAALATLGCLLLSATMEVAQLHVPGRSANGLDLLLNLAGGAAGAAVGVVFGAHRLQSLPAIAALRPAAPFAALLLACWLGYRLYPYVPALDLGEWRASLAPLLRGTLDPWRALRLAVLWLVAARLLEAAWPRAGGVLPFALLLAGVLAAAVPIADRRLTWDEVLAAALALGAWPLLRRLRRADAILLCLLFAVVLAEGLAPYRLATAPRDFGWMPFRAVMRGHWGIGLQAILLKFTLQGGLLWLALRAGFALRIAAPGVVLLALAVSFAQTWLPGRSAESTDAFLAAAAALLAWLLPRPAAGCDAGRR